MVVVVVGCEAAVCLSVVCRDGVRHSKLNVVGNQRSRREWRAPKLGGREAAVLVNLDIKGEAKWCKVGR